MALPCLPVPYMPPATHTHTHTRTHAVVVNTDGTLSRITNWDRMEDSEREVAKRRICKRNIERLKVFHEKGELKDNLMSALLPAESPNITETAVAETEAGTAQSPKEC